MRSAINITVTGLAALVTTCWSVAKVNAQNRNLAGNQEVVNQDFVTQAWTAASVELTLSKLAAEQGMSADVKKFAQMVLEDHSKTNAVLTSFADRKKISLPRQADRKHQDAFDKLSRLRGADFDREFAKQIVTDHDAVLTLFEMESKTGQDPDLKAWATQRLPTLRERMLLAHDLLEKTEKR
jgi:putative membrane protein